MDGVVCPICGSNDVAVWDLDYKCILYKDAPTSTHFAIPRELRLYKCCNCNTRDVTAKFWLNTLFDKFGKIFCIEDSFQLKLKHANRPKRK